MSAVQLGSITFTRNPSTPQGLSRMEKLSVLARCADGSHRVIDKGSRGVVRLTWPASFPMTSGDYTDLVALVRTQYGGVDTLTYTDADGTAHVARIADVDAAREVAAGYAVTVTLHLNGA